MLSSSPIRERRKQVWAEGKARLQGSHSKVDPASSGLARSFRGVWSEAFTAAGPGLLPRKGPNLGADDYLPERQPLGRAGSSWTGRCPDTAPGMEKMVWART